MYSLGTVSSSVSISSEGFDEVWEKINQFKQASIKENYYFKNRISQEIFWFETILKEEVFSLLCKNDLFAKQMVSLRSAIESGLLSSSSALYQLQRTIARLLNI